MSLRNHADQLPDIFCFIFTRFHPLCRVLSLWKDSIIIPVPKDKADNCLNDFSPAAPTCPIMKYFKIVIAVLGCAIYKLDQLQFAYISGRSVDDAASTFLNRTLTHLEGVKSNLYVVTPLKELL